MKQVNRVSCIKAAVAGLFLLLVHVHAIAQEEEVAPPVADTTITDEEYTVDTSPSVEEYPNVVYSGDEYIRVWPAIDSASASYRPVPGFAVERLQKDKAFEYANDPAYWEKEKPKEISGSWLDWAFRQTWLQYLLVGLVIAAVVFALYRILVSNRILLFRRTSRGGMAGEDEHEMHDDLLARINEAEQQRAFRLAVRYRYVKTLRDMHEQGLIHMDAQSTNWDYVNQLSAHPMKKTFQLLTRAYEYVWYGEFELSEEQYALLKTEFLQFENALRT